MIVVSNTTPLRHLIPIGEVGLLQKLYGGVIVPKAVWEELHAYGTPNLIKEWLENAPSWLQVRLLPSPPPDTVRHDVLDAGEREAI